MTTRDVDAALSHAWCELPGYSPVRSCDLARAFVVFIDHLPRGGFVYRFALRIVRSGLEDWVASKCEGGRVAGR